MAKSGIGHTSEKSDFDISLASDTYFPLNIEITEQDKNDLLEYEKNNDELYHRHSPGGHYTNLDFLRIPFDLCKSILKNFKIDPEYISLTTVPGNGQVLMHTDTMYEYRRDSVIVFPLVPDLNDYIPCTVYERSITHIPPSSCYVFNTQCPHSVENNSHRRTSLQLWYGKEISEMWNLHKQGKLLA